MKVFPNPLGRPLETENLMNGVIEMRVPVIAMENGSKTFGQYNWDSETLWLEDGRVFRLDFVSGDYIPITVHNP